MKALTIHQPWATLIARGEKWLEVRSWATDLRGMVAIHASSRRDRAAELLAEHREAWPRLREHGLDDLDQLPFGAVVAVAVIAGVHRISARRPIGVDETRPEYLRQHLALHLWPEGHFAWELEQVVRLPEPVPCRGRQGLWELDGHALETVLAGIPAGDAVDRVLRLAKPQPADRPAPGAA